MLRRVLRSGVGSAVVLLLLACASAWAVSAGEKVPKFTCATSEGTQVTSADLSDRVVAICFTATWVKTAGEELRFLQGLAVEFKDKNLLVLPVIEQEDKDTVAEFAARNKLNLALLLDSGTVARQFGVNGRPHVCVVDSAGTVRKWIPGYGPLPSKSIRAAIVPLLSDARPAKPARKPLLAAHKPASEEEDQPAPAADPAPAPAANPAPIQQVEVKPAPAVTSAPSPDPARPAAAEPARTPASEPERKPAPVVDPRPELPDLAADLPPTLRVYAHLKLGAAHIDIGDAFINVGQHDGGHYAEAVKEFRAGMALDPKNINLLVWLGVAYERKGDQAGAIHQYQAALTVDPQNTYARESLRRLRALPPAPPPPPSVAPAE